MSWVTDLFTGGVSSVVDSVGDMIDKLSTTKEEKNQFKLDFAKEMNRFKEIQLTATSNYDAEITKRHVADMASDSWLSKNIRPFTLAFLTFFVMLLAYLTLFILDASQEALVEPWLQLFTVLMF